MLESRLCAECGSALNAVEDKCFHCGGSVAQPAKGAYFPLQFYVDFLRYIAARPDHYKVITYDDLHWAVDERHPADYRSEYMRWLRSNNNSRKIFILLQHDVDSRPERTMEVLRHEAENKTPSNIMIFHRRIDRKKLKHAGLVEETDYNIDHELIRSLSKSQRFVVGYHCNAFERAQADELRASEIFRQDVSALRTHHCIRFFSPHGGVPSSDGRNNSSITVPEDMADLIWVHNRYSPSFKATYSDGGVNNRMRDPEKRDLISFVKSMMPGNRYRILTHPQYFDPVYREAPVLARSQWYREVLEHYRAKTSTSIWEKILA